VYIKLVVLLRNYVTMMHGQQNIKNGWATIVVVGRLRVNRKEYSSLTQTLCPTPTNTTHCIDGTDISLLLTSNESRSLCFDSIHPIPIWTPRRQPVNLQDSETGEVTIYHYVIMGYRTSELDSPFREPDRHCHLFCDEIKLKVVMLSACSWQLIQATGTSDKYHNVKTNWQRRHSLTLLSK
jgi:hypothetical protein